ncbi:4'-phosphopantetheinyl transferase family protein [Jhaorihella thermophila]|uniref:Enterobactin synthase component D n=1 Tax=Jhaorihella thermophila TaxID=488547 RepID=A0A1H5TGH4_9RHOB|nr:4'-phosphopantetheinyl transferase superfamily protein [Jhaorihella thermophila]SEF61191.1 4'-phosphopantetheinyl transferase EntD (siderophore biosynthesis) [Jhaorihella thermophila]
MTVALDGTAAALAGARSLFPPEVAVAATDPRAAHPAPLPEEADAAGRWALVRLREFAAGRAAVRIAMAELGVPPCPVPMGADRAPVWPEGLVGSISHSRTACLAALTRAGDIRALGVDVEEDTPLEPTLEETILTAAERDRLRNLPPMQRGRRAKLIFSAKESAYKCQYPVSRTLLDFDAFEILFDAANGGFSAIFRRAVGPFPRGAALTGRHAVAGGLIITSVTLRRETGGPTG